MRRLPAEGMLDKLVAAGKITSTVMREVSRIIAHFHQSAPTSPTISDHGRVERIMYNWQENFDQMIPFEYSTLSACDRELIRAWATSFALEHEHIFRQRVENGYIRECDGDIHLENICLDDGNIHIFDCIEFNDRFRCCDTAADIAFLLMDLDYHGRHDLAADVIDEYVSMSGDAGAVTVIDFYKTYRAFVRGKVESFRLNDNGINYAEQAIAKNRAIRYFRLVRGYTERAHLKPTLFITCGLMGTGKSTLTEQLTFELGVRSYNSDLVRKQMAGISSDKQVSEGFNEGLYDQSAHDATYAELLRLAEQQLTTGSSVIIDAGFTHCIQRSPFTELAERYAVPLIILHLSCSENEIKNRLLLREASGRSVSDGRVDLLADQKAGFEPPVNFEGIVLALDATGSPATLADAVYKGLSSC
jgi:predicted kinase